MRPSQSTSELLSPSLGREGRDSSGGAEAPALPSRDPYGDVPLGVEAAWPALIYAWRIAP